MGKLINGLTARTHNAFFQALRAAGDPEYKSVCNEEGYLVKEKLRKLLEDGSFAKRGRGVGPHMLNELRVWCGLPEAPTQTEARFERMADELRAAGYTVTKNG